MNIKKGTLNILTITGRVKDINNCLFIYLFVLLTFLNQTK